VRGYQRGKHRLGALGLKMKVEKPKFDTLLGKVPHTKPEPRKAIKTPGRKGPKTPIPSK
jgi:hypothetical protein